MYWKNIINQINAFGFGVIILLPILFIIGTTIADIGISLLAIIFLLNLNAINIKKYFFNYFFPPFLFISLYFISLSL